MTIIIDFNVDDTERNIAALLRKLTPQASGSIAPNTEVIINLENCGFLGPSAVVTLSGLRRLFAGRNLVLRMNPPNLPRLRNYCGYAGLLKEFELGPEPNPNHPESVTTPMRAFEGDLPVDAIREVVRLAKSQMTLSTVAEDDLTLALSELAQNVVDHAESPIGGFISARAYQHEREVRFAVADFGIGIRGSLGRRISAASDVDAIRESLREEVTSRSSRRNLGLGLAHLHAIVRLAKGRMVIYSGNGFVKHEGGKDFFGTERQPYPGTIAFVRLPAREATEPVPPDDVWA